MTRVAGKPAVRPFKARLYSLLLRLRVRLISRRSLRTAIAVLAVLVLTWIFGQAGVLDKLDRAGSDIQSRLNPAPTDGTVAVVVIDDNDYRQIFDGGIPVNAGRLIDLVNDIAKGGPSVIGIDIDSSPHQFAETAKALNCNCTIVWEREVEELPETVEANQELKLLPILGGRSDLNNARISSGIPILIDDPEDGTTRRFQRYFGTDNGLFPSFTTALTSAYAKEKNLASLGSQVATFSDQELLIRYSGDQQGSHRIQLSASKLHELSQNWRPDASPIEGRIVLLGGAYLGQDQHKTPIGQISGVEILANVIETELHGQVATAPSRLVLYLLDLFEAFGLILMFHFWPFRTAILRSVALIPLVAALFSFGVYSDVAHFGQFFVVLVGLLFYELYEHFRREQFPHLIEEKKSGHH